MPIVSGLPYAVSLTRGDLTHKHSQLSEALGLSKLLTGSQWLEVVFFPSNLKEKGAEVEGRNELFH